LALSRAVDQAKSSAHLERLIAQIIAINGWNRLAIPFRSEPGSYRPNVADAG